eukprot:222426_1
MAFMAWQPANNVQYPNTTNDHSNNQHTRSLSSSFTHNVTYQNQIKQESDWFTMIFIDCDDTLIPSKLHRYLYRHLGIDIFNLYKHTMLKQFQYDIINAIEAIKQTFTSQYNEEIKIAIVSNASTRWLNVTINNTSENAYFPILSSYFIESKIAIKSAIDETFEFLCKKFGKKNKDKVNEMIAMSLNKHNANHSKWMLKYTTYSSIINKYKRKLKKKCRKIVNFGDGETEIAAIKNYAQTFGVDYMALKFIKNSTFSQLTYQWKYIANNILSIISDMDIDNIYNLETMNLLLQSKTSPVPHFNSVIVQTSNKNRYKHKRNLSNFSDVSTSTTASHKALNVFYFDYILKNDNNQYFTGNNQINAIRTYFEKWISIHVLNQKSETDQNAVLKWICTKIHSFMKGKDPYSDYMIAFKKIIQNGLCKNKQFKYAFDNYYNQIRNNLKHSNTNNKRRKSIDESKISDDIPPIKQNKLYRKRSGKHNKNNNNKKVKNRVYNVNNIKDGSLSLMNLGKKYKCNSIASVSTHGTIATNTPESLKSKSKSIEFEGIYYSDDGEYMYLSQKSQYGDEEDSSSPNI